tara:strand:+ start:4597 stop:5496 length:900 start_codon:yes stop_codon:yes gene_type:complete
MLYKIKNYLFHKLGLLFFKQGLSLDYILYNFFYKKFIIKNVRENNWTKKLYNSGYSRLEISAFDLVNDLKKKIVLDDEQNKINNPTTNRIKRFKFLDKNVELDFIKKLKVKLEPIFNDLKKYYNCKVDLAEIRLFRIENYQTTDLKNELYSNNFHQDGYILNYSKIFINLMDVGIKDGPLEIVPIEKKRKFIKSSNFKNRYEYKTSGYENLIFKNTGRIGDCTLFSSTEVFHRATIPENYRDMAQLIVFAAPEEILQKVIPDDENLLKPNQQLRKYSKPFSLLSLIKFYFRIRRNNYSI